MKKELKDYLHLYLGCGCMIGDINWKRPVIAECDLAPYTDLDYGKPIKTILDLHCIQKFSHKITPILRPLSDLQPEDQNFFGCDDEYFAYIKTMSHQIFACHADEFHYLLSKQFDLFGLIESGLALDATLIQNTGTSPTK